MASASPSTPRALPSGTLTFLFTEIEGSTRLVQAVADAAFEQAYAEGRALTHDEVASLLG